MGFPDAQGVARELRRPQPILDQRLPKDAPGVNDSLQVGRADDQELGMEGLRPVTPVGTA
jgi:hypothetical protein